MTTTTAAGRALIAEYGVRPDSRFARSVQDIEEQAVADFTRRLAAAEQRLEQTAANVEVLTLLRAETRQQDASALRTALVSGMAYALARAPLPKDTESSRDYAGRLAPLVIESGYLALPPSAPAALPRTYIERIHDAKDRLLADRLPDVDSLAQIIREVDGDHSLGAGALSEAILARLAQDHSPENLR